MTADSTIIILKMNPFVVVCKIYVIFTFSLLLCFSDMVKRLLNKMDFEALEVKIQKCKVSDHETIEIMSCTSLLPPSSSPHITGAVLPASRH